MISLTRALLVCLACAFLAFAARAQDTTPGDTGAEDGANSVQVQEERLQVLIDTLEDDEKRADLVAQLRLLLEAQDQAVPPDERPSVSDQLLGQLSQQFEVLGEAVDAVLAAPEQMADFWVWLQTDVATESGLSRWQDILRTIGICIGAAILAFVVVAYPVRRLGRRLARPRKPGPVKLLAGIGGLLLDALPIIAFATAGSATLAAIETGAVARAMSANLLSVITIALAVCALIRVLTRPRRPAMRLMPVSDAVARDLTRRLFWVVGVMAAAYAFGRTLPLIGMPWSARSAVLTLAALISVLLLIVAIFKHRLLVRYGLERSAARGTMVGDILHWLARNWHLLATLLMIVFFIAYVVGGEVLFVELVGRIGWSLLVAIGAILVWHLATALGERQARKAQAEEADGDVVRKSGHLLLKLFGKVIMAGIVIALLVHVWLFDIIEWFGAEAGKDLLEAVVTIGIIIGLAFLANRAIAAIIDRIRYARRAESAELRRRRVETLLPLLRSAAAIVISAVALLIVLSEIGLDITPLLASAGVIGLAIGFGAQSLVKDVITGLFILMEDAVGIGDVVTVGGNTGVVEEMSIRTIRLRDFGGVQHVIPFGVVDTVSNLTRDFSFSVFEVGVAYDSDVDKVKQAMIEVDEQLRSDPEMAINILEPLQIFGVDSFGDNAVVIKARIKTKPGQQWGVMRAYNGLMKKKFDAEGIEIPFPQRTLHIPAAQLAELTRPNPEKSARKSDRRRKTAKPGEPGEAPATGAVQSEAPVADDAPDDD